jgi:hypothetical protein
MRAVVLAIGVVVLAGSANASAPSWRRPPPLRPIDGAAFAELLQSLKAEPFPDGKLSSLRATTAKRYTLTCAQLVTVLDTFQFWGDRVDAVRLVVLDDPAHVDLVLRYFDDAPYFARRDARSALH